MNKIAQIITIFILLAITFPVISQPPVGLTITGQVIDKKSRQPLEYATVTLLDKQTNKIITGGVTNASGRFAIKTTSATPFYLKVDFIGYVPVVINKLEQKQGHVNLPTIAIANNDNLLGEVTVTAEKSQTIFKLDKRVFNVGKDLISAGGSSLDVLNNVPSVSVSIEGAVSLRGNANVQILINGKPSVMTSGNSNTLGAITADMIERIEVITNPSAKYDAKGTTGIINIVLKKDERKGLNGSVTLNTGIPHNHSIGLSLNRRTEKFNLFAQLGVGKRMFPSNYRGITIDRSTTGNVLHNNGNAEKHELFYNARLGTDYHINAHNVLTLSGNFAYEIEDETSDTRYSLLNSNGQVLNLSERNENTEATNPKWQYDLQYKKTFANNKNQSLLMSATGTFFGKDKTSNFKNTNLEGTFSDFEQAARTAFSEAMYTFRLDYTHPFSKKSTLETGAKYDLNDISNDYAVADLVNNVWVNNASFTNVFTFDQKVLGAYATYAHEVGKVGIKAGIRVENVQLNTALVAENLTNQQQYTNAFPSVHLSYKLTNQLSTQLSYSKRIHRPRMWDLNPFTSLRDNLNQFTGNPNLLPEYTDSYEFTAIQNWETVSINMSVFHRRTSNLINDITQVIDSLTITSPQNVGNSNNTGVEVNGKATPAKWLTFLADFNWAYFARSGQYDQTSFDFENTRWSGRFTAKIKLPLSIDVELRMRYRSDEQQLLGVVRENFYGDFGLRKKLWKGRAVINFSVRDVLSSRRYITEIDQPVFYRYSNRQWGGRRMVLGLSFGFGKGDAMEFSGHKH